MSGKVVSILAIALAIGSARQIRDAGGPPIAGTAVVTGVVSEGGANPQPLRRAIVTLSGANVPVPRSGITDDAGHYTFQSLPAGRIDLTAAKRGYINGAFGAKRPAGAGTPIELHAGESITADIQLIRGAVLSGSIRNLRGEPVSGLRVFALDGGKPRSPRPLGPVNGAANLYTTTDDRGMYRLYDLAPGQYVVVAVPEQGVDGQIALRSAEDNDAILSRLRARTSASNLTGAQGPFSEPTETAAVAPVFFPGTISVKGAARITLGPGDVREGLDFTASNAVRVSTIEGTVIGAGQSPIELSIVPEDTLQFFGLGTSLPRLVQPPGPDGRFKFGTIMPGHYTIWARARIDLSAPSARGRNGAPIPNDLLPMMAGRSGFGVTAETLYAVTEVDVGAQPIRGVTLQLQRGSRISGKIVVDTDGAPLTDLSVFRVSARPSEDGSYTISGTTRIGTFSGASPVIVGPDGSFELVGVPPGPYTLQIGLQLPSADKRVWWPRSAIFKDRDLLDAGVAVSAGQDMSDVTVTMTDRRSEIAGILQGAQGHPAPEYFVVVMPADSRMWNRTAVRRMKFTRPATDGSFSFGDLPPGDYLIAALTDIDPDRWQESDFLAGIAPAGVRVTLGPNQRIRQDLQIQR